MNPVQTEIQIKKIKIVELHFFESREWLIEEKEFRLKKIAWSQSYNINNIL